MGLDMHLSVTVYEGDCYVDYEVFGWGKAGQIFKWFDKNICDGKIEPDKIYGVSWEQLRKLVDDCRTVSIDHSLAQDILPTVDGHGLLGNCEYDDWYFWEVERTMRLLGDMLKSDEPYSKCLKYRFYASW